MPLRFGTDGLRGVAGPQLSPELLVALGRAAGEVLGIPRRPWLVGRDTRWSGPMVQAALSAGLAASGWDVVDLGVLPTPAVAWAAGEAQSPAAVISASHNPFADNGVKLLAPGGRKLSPAQEEQVEAAMEKALAAGADRPDAPSARSLGRLSTDPAAVGRYCAALPAALEGRSFGGLRVAVDCGNGAAVTTAVPVLEAAGARLVSVLSDEPDGTNINAACGSTDPTALAASVVSEGAAAGLAFDGDADRLIAVDERGAVVDGDRLIVMLATDLKARGALRGGVAVTVMSNLGLLRAMEAAGIDVCVTPVGDRHVVEALEERGWSLGGEQSGHLVFRDRATTGDGLLTGLMLLDLLARTALPLSELAGAAMDRVPQVLRNVRVVDPKAAARDPRVTEAVAGVEAELGAGGRVLLRPSGTEPVLRIMVEAPTEDLAEEAVERLSRAAAEAVP